MKLFAPQIYWQLSNKGMDLVCNGCGPKGFDFLVPDKIFGVRITPACNIHDYMYFVGETLADKEEADRVFLNNMLRIIKKAKGVYAVRYWRKRLAYKYYMAVRDFGGPAYWSSKNDPKEYKTIKEVT